MENFPHLSFRLKSWISNPQQPSYISQIEKAKIAFQFPFSNTPPSIFETVNLQLGFCIGCIFVPETLTDYFRNNFLCKIKRREIFDNLQVN